MEKHKNLLQVLGDWWAERQTQASAKELLPTSRSNQILRWFIPNGGTLLIVALLLITQTLWAKPFTALNTSGSTATTVNYQGRLSDSDGVPLDGTYGISFALYDAATDGNLIWGPEAHTAVEVSDGLFSVGLGSRTSGGIPTTTWNGDRYLEIAIDGETLEPRELVRSVPIAGMALTVPDGAIEGRHLTTGFGASDKPLLNFVPTDPQQVIRLEYQSDIDRTELDLANYVSPTATRVMIWAFIKDGNGVATLKLFGPNEYWFNLRNFSTSSWTHDHIVVPLSENQTIRYWLDAKGTNSASFEIRVIGYWEPVR